MLKSVDSSFNQSLVFKKQHEHMVKKCVVTFLKETAFFSAWLCEGVTHFFDRGMHMGEEKKVCCFFGHRKIEEGEQLRKRLYVIIEELIISNNVGIFLFGSRSEFDDLCLAVVTELIEKYPHIRHVYVRAEYPYIRESYEKYLMQSYEETYFPARAVGAGRAVYVERNYEMIDRSDICVLYYIEGYTPPIKENGRQGTGACQKKSGTQLAYAYARRKKRKIINVMQSYTS